MCLKSMRVKMMLVCGVIACGASAADGHISLLAPNGGEVLTSGTTATISWEILIQHNTENWDVYYSVSGPDGPWELITEDLERGEVAAGTIHSFDWTVPELDSDEVRIRVVQDNDGMDWDDVSDENLSISPPPPPCAGDWNGDGRVDSVDFFDYTNAFFDGDADFDANGLTNSADFFGFLNAFLGGC